MIGAAVYSLKRDGNVQLSANFTVKEFACKDGSDIVIIDPLLVWILQNVRAHFKKPVDITSAYRTVAYNATLRGSAKDSYHMLGMAADFVVRGVPAADVQEYLEMIMPATGGIGKAKNYTHVDTRAVRARWVYS